MSSTALGSCLDFDTKESYYKTLPREKTHEVFIFCPMQQGQSQVLADLMMWAYVCRERLVGADNGDTVIPGEMLTNLSPSPGRRLPCPKLGRGVQLSG